MEQRDFARFDGQFPQLRETAAALSCSFRLRVLPTSKREFMRAATIPPCAEQRRKTYRCPTVVNSDGHGPVISMHKFGRKKNTSSRTSRVKYYWTKKNVSSSPTTYPLFSFLFFSFFFLFSCFLAKVTLSIYLVPSRNKFFKSSERKSAADLFEVRSFVVSLRPVFSIFLLFVSFFFFF